MRMLHIIVNGQHHSTIPAGVDTAEELQHEIAQRSGGLVRVIEFIKEDPPREQQRWEGGDYED